MVAKKTAHLNGLLLECENLTTGFEKAVDVHEFPFSDESLVVDLGQKARSVLLRCYFLNDRYPEHKTLLALLDRPGLLELEHPDYGLLSGAVKRVAVRRDDREETAEIDLEFVAGAASIKPVAVLDVAADAEGAYQDGLDQARDHLETAVVEALGGDAAPVLGATVALDEDVLPQVTGISAAARNLVRKVDAVVRTLEAEIADVATPANALISTIQFGEDLPGRVIGAMARTAHRYSVLLDSIADAPDRFLDNLKDSLDQLSDELFPDGDDGTGTYGAWLSVCALEAVLTAGAGFDADQDARARNRKSEGLPRFDALGRALPYVTPETVMNVREIEAALYTVRALAEAALAAARDIPAVKAGADALTRHVSETKLEMERIISVALAAPVPLHLVCLRRGLSYQAAGRVLALNPDLENPNFTSGTVDLYVR